MARGEVVAIQQRIETEMHLGKSLDAVERDVIEPADLPKDTKAALWLYAWSFVPVRDQRREVTAIALMTTGGAARL